MMIDQKKITESVKMNDKINKQTILFECSKGYVFISNGRPYYIKFIESERIFWVYRWNEGNQNWVTLKKVSEDFVSLQYGFRLPEKEAQLYHEKNRKFENAILHTK